MSTTGPNLGLLDGGLYGENVYHETLRLYRALDFLTQPSVISATLDTPPTEPDEGDAYIVPAAATGDWADHENDIARWTLRDPLLPDGVWEFFTPRKNWLCGVDDAAAGDGAIYRFNSTTWVSLL